jgi:hypothetical protein
MEINFLKISLMNLKDKYMLTNILINVIDYLIGTLMKTLITVIEVFIRHVNIIYLYTVYNNYIINTLQRFLSIIRNLHHFIKYH